MPRLSTRHSTSRDPGRERVFTDDESRAPLEHRAYGARCPVAPSFVRPIRRAAAIAPHPQPRARGAPDAGLAPPVGIDP